MPNSPTDNKALTQVETFARLLDSQFTIPGTNIKFGLDAIVGLLPVGGDAASFLASSGLVLVMARNGASGAVVARMVFNIALDALIGAIPVLGDLFDVAFKANNRNVKLLRAHYQEGKHRGSGWPIFIVALFALILIGGALAWILWQLGALVVSLFSA